MIVEVPEQLEAAIRTKARAQGVSPAGYVRDVLQREFAPAPETQSRTVPYKTGRGSFAQYGQAPSREEIDANRTDMFGSFGEEAG